MQIYGSERHSSGEIASGLLDNVPLKNTLYLLWKYRNGEVPDNMPYLETLHVQMKSPSRVDVHVTEKNPVAYVDKGGYAYIDQEGTVLEITDQTYSGIPIITGASVEEPVLYQKLPVQSSAQLRTILSLAQLLSYQGVGAEEIRFGDNMEITVFTGSVQVELGQDEYLEEKVANLAKILPRLEGQTGVLHLESFTGRNEQVPFTPGEGLQAEGGEGSGEGGEDAGDGTGEGGEDAGDGSGEGAGEGGEDAGEGDGGAENGDGQADGDGGDAGQDDSGTVYPMVFNSSGELVYNVHVSNGTVVDEYGNPVPGVTINENGNVVDAYMNVFDPETGELIQQ